MTKKGKTYKTNSKEHSKWIMILEK
jgi:hypothetical protein